MSQLYKNNGDGDGDGDGDWLIDWLIDWLTSKWFHSVQLTDKEVLKVQMIAK